MDVLRSKLPTTALYLLLPIEGIGVLCFLAYVAFHFDAFLHQTTAIFAWLVWFGGLALYTGLAYLVVRLVRAGLETLTAFGHAIADIYAKFVATRLAQTRRELLHTDSNYVVYRVNGEIVVQSVIQEKVTYNYRDTVGNTRAIAEVDDEPEYLLPSPVKSFAELLEAGTVQEALAEGEMLLGYTSDGQPRYGSWLDLYSCGIGGVSGSGKTTTVRFLLFQAVLADAHFVMIDPHIHDEKESLAAQFRMFPSVHLIPPCDETPREILKRVRWLDKEIKRRIALGVKTPGIVFILDEFNAIVRRLPDDVKRELAELLLTIAQEGRKFGVFAMLIAQRWSEQDLGGKNAGAAIRSSLASTLAHRFTDEDQARKLIGSKHGPKCLELEQGHWYFRDTQGALSEMITPLTVETDGLIIQRLLASRNQPEQGYENSPNTAPEQRRQLAGQTVDALARNLLESPEKPIEKPINTDKLEQQDPAILHKMQQVLKLQSEGKQKGDIIKALWGVSPGASKAYETANNEYQQIMKLAYERLGA